MGGGSKQASKDRRKAKEKKKYASIRERTRRKQERRYVHVQDATAKQLAYEDGRLKRTGGQGAGRGKEGMVEKGSLFLPSFTLP